MSFSVRYDAFQQVKDGLSQVKDRSLMMENFEYQKQK
jgi:hypothetical protein